MATMHEVPRNPYQFSREEYNALVAKLPRQQISARSEYEEIELIEDCTLYDIYRQPRAPIMDDTCTKSIAMRELNPDLTCPICLSICRHTMVVMECLHRFCGECIQKCLRGGNKECPSCRIHIPSKRSLRKDENFDDLIAQVYPKLDEFEQKENELIEKLNRQRHCNNALTQSLQLGAQNQANNRKQGKRKSPPSTANDRVNGNGNSASKSEASSGSNSPTNGPNSRKKNKSETSSTAVSAKTSNPPPGSAPGTPAAATAKVTTPKSTTTTPTSTAKSLTTNATATSGEEKVNLRVNLHPLDKTSPKLERTLFRTSPKLKIRHLKKHLLGLLHAQNATLKQDQMRIVLVACNCTLSGLTAKCLETNQAVRKELLYDQELQDHWTLRELYDQFGMGLGWEIQLQYHFSADIANPMAQFIQESTNIRVQ